MQTRGTWGRVVLAVVVLAIGVVIGWFASSLFSVPSGRVGWLWAALMWTVVLGLPVLVLAPRRRWWWLAAAAVLATAIGVGSWYTAPPTADRLAAAYDDRVVLPSSFVEVDRQHYGNSWCFKGCPEMTVEHEVPAGWSEEERSRRLAEALRETGWSEDSQGWWSQGRWRLRELNRLGGPTVTVQFTR